MENSAFRQGRLFATGTALKDFHAAFSKTANFIAVALRATEAIRPAEVFNNGLALLLVAIPVNELAQAQTCLKLDSVGLHGSPLVGFAVIITQGCDIICPIRVAAEDSN